MTIENTGTNQRVGNDYSNLPNTWPHFAVRTDELFRCYNRGVLRENWM